MGYDEYIAPLAANTPPWISQFLRENPDVRFSPIKEICFFDSKYTDERKNALLERYNTKFAVLGLGNYIRKYPISGLRLCHHYLGIRTLKDVSYRAFFDELARDGSVAGEITPSYAVLHKEAVTAMDALLNQPNYFLILRNPIDRLVSQYSFRITRPSLRVGAKFPVSAGRLEDLVWLGKTSIHNNYHITLKTFRTVVPPDRFKVMFTEHLFNPLRHQSECDSLCDFLGVSRRKGPISKTINRAPEILITARERATLAATLAETYAGVARDFAAELPENWKQDFQHCQ